MPEGAGLFPTPPQKVRFVASNQLKTIAQHAVAAAAGSTDRSLIAVVFSALWFEASVNDAIIDIRDGALREHGARQELVQAAVREARLDGKFVRVRKKLDVLCRACTDRELDPYAEPWRSVLLLFDARNWLVHLQPEELNVRTGREDEPSSLVSTEVHRLVTALREAGAFGQIPEGRMVPVTHALQQPGVAAWAFRAAGDGLREVDRWMPYRYPRLA